MFSKVCMRSRSVILKHKNKRICHRMTSTHTTQTTQSQTKVVVIGGSGYVGRQICQQAVVRGHFVTSVNLRGKPAALENEEWADKVTWLKADVFKPDEWDAVISADTTVVASVGALGSAETMERMCGTANVIACETAAKKQAQKFVLISASPMNTSSLEASKSLPVLGGYVRGKEIAELSVRHHFGDTEHGDTSSSTSDEDIADAKVKKFAILRPGFVYGSKGGIPLQLIGWPMKKIFSIIPFHKLPILGPIFFEPPVSVTSLAKATILCVEEHSERTSGVVGTNDIDYFATVVNQT